MKILKYAAVLALVAIPLIIVAKKRYCVPEACEFDPLFDNEPF